MAWFVVTLFWVVIATALALAFLYDFCVSLAGLRRPPGPPPARRKRRFAILVPAHNEQAVIARTVESLRSQTYPANRYEVFVVADRCSDRTAAEAARAGATVFERNDLAGGKSAALRALLERVALLRGPFDAVCVFDADNLASPEYLESMNRHLDAGERCIQGYLDVKNPEDTWITGAISIAYWVANRLWQAARYRLRLCCALGGTGFCLDWELATRLAWRSDCLTDDLELQMALVLAGERVSWAHEAKTYDEKPLDLRSSWQQRLRWMRGHWDVARRDLLPLLTRGLRRFDPVAMDAALYLLQPLRTVIGAVALLAILGLPWTGGERTPLSWPAALAMGSYFAYLAHACFGGIPLLGLALERVPLRHWRFYPHAFLFGITWIPIAFWGIATSRRTTWNPTRHTRALTLEDRLAAESPGRHSECLPTPAGQLTV